MIAYHWNCVSLRGATARQINKSISQPETLGLCNVSYLESLNPSLVFIPHCHVHSQAGGPVLGTELITRDLTFQALSVSLTLSHTPGWIIH